MFATVIACSPIVATLPVYASDDTHQIRKSDAAASAASGNSAVSHARSTRQPNVPAGTATSKRSHARSCATPPPSSHGAGTLLLQSPSPSQPTNGAAHGPGASPGSGTIGVGRSPSALGLSPSSAYVRPSGTCA